LAPSSKADHAAGGGAAADAFGGGHRQEMKTADTEATTKHIT
jgi:hypothetical protein